MPLNGIWMICAITSIVGMTMSASRVDFMELHLISRVLDPFQNRSLSAMNARKIPRIF